VIAGTHIAFASTLYLGGAALFEYDTDLVGWALASAASLLPDADLPTSKIGRALFWLSAQLERRFGHRTPHPFVHRHRYRRSDCLPAAPRESGLVLVRCWRLLVAPLDRHAQYPWHRSPLALPYPSRDARQPQLADGSGEQGGDGAVDMPSSSLPRALSGEWFGVQSRASASTWQLRDGKG
jgi:LexA-binding, inner membrane-associated putative hydrolase